jgi:hypothetical protein
MIGDLIHAGRVSSYRAKVLYCGKVKNQCRCGTCDGRCGPDNGCPCNACKNTLLRLRHLEAYFMKNDDGDLIYRGNGNLTAGDTGLPACEVFYCGKTKHECRCGECDGQCGPSNGCPCDSCKRVLVRSTAPGYIIFFRNSDGARVFRGTGDRGTGYLGMSSSSVYYCGRWKFQCHCGGLCDGRCGPDNGCPCDACVELLNQPSVIGDGLINSQGAIVLKGYHGYSTGDVHLPGVDIYYCGRRMNECRCGLCDGVCGPSNGCPCNSCKQLLALDKNYRPLRNKAGFRVHKGSMPSIVVDLNVPALAAYCCGRSKNEGRRGECDDDRCGPIDGCPCDDCMLLWFDMNGDHRRASPTEPSSSHSSQLKGTAEGTSVCHQSTPDDELCIICMSESKSATFVYEEVGHVAACLVPIVLSKRLANVRYAVKKIIAVIRVYS